jgi:hypothetical protein
MIERRHVSKTHVRTPQGIIPSGNRDEDRRILRKVKVKMSLCLTKYHAMKILWVSDGIAPRILNIGAKWS